MLLGHGIYRCMREVTNTVTTMFTDQGQDGLLEVGPTAPFVDLYLYLSDGQLCFLLTTLPLLSEILTLWALSFSLSLIMFMAPKTNFWGLISPKVFYCKEWTISHHSVNQWKPSKLKQTLWPILPCSVNEPLIYRPPRPSTLVFSSDHDLPGDIQQCLETHWVVQTREEVSMKNVEWVLGSRYAAKHPIMCKQLQERVVCSPKTSCLTVKKLYLQSFTTGPHAKLTDIPSFQTYWIRISWNGVLNWCST